jgi:hypothetical protein
VPLQLDTITGTAGKELDASTRRRMEAGFGTDLSAIRVLDGAAPAAAARQLSAAAFTVGRHIGFARGRLRPSRSGRWLLAHEIAHALQQRNVSQVPGNLGAPAIQASPALEREADAAADSVAAGRCAPPLSAAPIAVACHPDDRLLTDDDIDTAVDDLEETAEPVGKGLRGFEALTLDIDESTAVSKGGSWDDAANKRFLESTTNRLTKNDLTEVAPPTPTSQISLAAAKAQGEATFRAAAEAMLNRNFSDVAELSDIVTTIRGRFRVVKGRRVSVLRSRINGRIRAEIANPKTPQGRLVNEALRLLGIDPKGLRVRPLRQIQAEPGKIASHADPETHKVGDPGRPDPVRATPEPSKAPEPEKPPEQTKTSDAEAKRTVEARGEPIEPLTDPAASTNQARGAIEGAATMINSGLFEALQGYEVQRAIKRWNEIAPEISRAQHSGYDVTLRVLVEKPDTVDPLAHMTGTANQSQIVYFKDMWIASVVRKRLSATPPPSTTQTSATSGGQSDYRDRRFSEYTDRPHYHVEAGNFPFPALDVKNGTYRPTAVDNVIVTPGISQQTAKALALQRTLVILGEDAEFRLWDDDSRKRWQSEMPHDTPYTSIAAQPDTYRTRFSRMSDPKASIESTWWLRTIQKADQTVVGFSEVATGESLDLGSHNARWFAIVTWTKIHD